LFVGAIALVKKAPLWLSPSGVAVVAEEKLERLVPRRRPPVAAITEVDPRAVVTRAQAREL